MIESVFINTAHLCTILLQQYDLLPARARPGSLTHAHESSQALVEGFEFHVYRAKSTGKEYTAYSNMKLHTHKSTVVCV
jgi:hypothetical protein